MMKRTLTILSILTLTVTGCITELSPLPAEGEDSAAAGGAGTEATVRFSIVPDRSTRSSITVDERQLDDVNIYAYCDGMLHADIHTTTPQTASMKLRRGTRYNLYAVANMGTLSPAVKEEDFISGFAVKVGSMAELEGHNPMVWSLQGFEVTGGDTRVDMEMKRLLSKIHFKLDRGTLRGLEVKSVRLRQAANTVRPFVPGGSRALSASEVTDGDYASPEDIAQLNSTGEGIHFYALENMQGTLLPGNGDPWKKIPESISGKDRLCTYIEVKASFKEGFFYSGDVTYRFYLGQNSTTNFDIIRNNDTGVVLTLSGDSYGEGPQDISWKVILDTGICRNGYASYELGRHIHGGNLLYISERFELNVTLKEELFNHLDRNINNCYVAPIRQNTEEKIPGVMRFTPLKAVSLAEDDNRFTCIGTLVGRAIWRFGLFDRRTDRLISIISNAADPAVIHRAHTPLLCVSTYGDRNIYSLGGYGFDPKCAKLNGPEVTYYLYLHDQEYEESAVGTERWCDLTNMYDPTLFAGEADSRSIDMGIFQDLQFQSFIHIDGGKIPAGEHFEFRYEPAGAEENVPYIGRIHVKAKNDGIRHQAELVRLVTPENQNPRHYSIVPTSDLPYIGYNSLPQFPFLIEPVGVRFYNDHGHHCAEITNTSRLPLHVRGSYHFCADNFGNTFASVDMNAPDVGYAYTNDANSTAIAPSRLVARFSFDDREDSTPGGDGGRYTTQLGSWVSPGGEAGLCICDITFMTGGTPYAIGENQMVMGKDVTDRIHVFSKGTSMLMNRMDDPTPQPGSDGQTEARDMATERTMNVDDWESIFSGGSTTLGIDSRGIQFNLPIYLTDPLQMTCHSNCWSKYKDDKGTPPNGPFLDFTRTAVNTDSYPAWESEMEKFKTSQYRRTYWHTSIHTAEGKHIVHPYIYRIVAQLGFNIVTEKAGIVPFCRIPAKVSYTRDHIDHTAPKNDDSVYGYTVDVTLDNRYHNIYFID